MSTPDADPPFDVQKQITHIRRARSETDKFAAEQPKLTEEATKLAADTSPP